MKYENKIPQCVNPERPCRGCDFSYYPKLYDGGCMFAPGAEEELFQIYNTKGPGAAAIRAKEIRWERWGKENGCYDYMVNIHKRRNEGQP